MKRFHFRLERLLRLKRQQEKQAELRTAAARMAADAARAEVTTLNDLMAEAAAAMDAQAKPRNEQPQLWFDYQRHAAQISQAIERAEQKEMQANQTLREADAARARIATEVETLIHLRDQRLAEHRQDAARNTQRQLDELVLERWWSRTTNELRKTVTT